ncbi:WD40-like Beta Propeller Repeat [Muriicola jejuensis]|uniref:Transporter n=1 Tax=Muriicola jejuensis TaxID=504488 RepID=A0A6P0UFS9_9FLAO|nr:PD40 domain-containing protein [Muriicola jejuensis]NER11482.1 transporter [Muriicola jejuensis]SMP20429.1 WD40-like Beta Propeller Repeat [Muriicola jejuensis]
MKTIWILTCLLTPLIWVIPQENTVISRLEVYDLATGQRSVVREENADFEAPNWSIDGDYFVINQNGLLYSVSRNGSEKAEIFTGDARNCNNDHGISPDGSSIALSNNDPAEDAPYGSSRIYTIPISGGTPSLITPEMPSYWHGWSPDSRSVLYVAHRGEDFDIYRKEIEGTEEVRLTGDPGLDDGPEFSPDGQYIYYNSFRSGMMEIWRMRPDGSQKEMMTDDEYSNWFPHPSPDGKYFVFLSYLEDQGQAHPALKRVALRLFDLQSGKIRTLCSFTGGQGTINVPSWSPDSLQFAFVSYEVSQEN